MGPTRPADLLVVGVVAAAIAYLITRFNYSSIPTLPRLAGATAALIGVGEAIAGAGLRSRIRSRSRAERGASTRPPPPPVPALTAARAVQVAKASALAGSALAGLWLGFGVYVALEPGSVVAARADTVTAIVGLVCAGALLAGALFLENCCRTPDDGPPGGISGR